MNLTRLGHYHVPTGRDDSGYCQTALVIAVDEVDVSSFSDTKAETVNLMVWERDGDHFVRRDVPVAAPAETTATFHLSTDCPWKR